MRIRKAIEICSCAGGMALGFRRAGVEFELVFDKDDDACKSYTHNLGHAPIKMDLLDLLRLVRSGWTPGAGALDLFVADPPCQPWSTAGKQQGLEDDRDCLRPVVELIELLGPRAFLLGNVPGLEHANAADALAETVGSLSFRGYCIDHIVLDAADYGVPQHRIRPFWFGHRGGLCITWPAATHGPPSRQLEIGGTELAPWVTCRQALSDLPVDELGKIRNLQPPKKHPNGSGHPWSEVDAPARTICARHDGGSGGGDVLKVMADGYPPSHADAPARTVTTRASAGGNRMIVEPITENAKHPPSRPDTPSHTIGAKARGNGACVLEWPWDRPATTVCGDNWIPQPGHTQTRVDKHEGKPYQGWRAVVLSERARARLQGFPDVLCGCNGGYDLADLDRLHEALEMAEPIDASGRIYRAEDCCDDCGMPRRPWIFAGATKGSRNGQIGMAMPPPLAEAIGRSVREWFDR